MKRYFARGSMYLLVLTLIAGCGGTKKVGITPPATTDAIEAAPKWYLNPPQDSDFLYAAGTATSRDMQLATDKATDAAKFNLAKSVETRFEAISKRFQEEVGTALDAQYLDQFTQATKSTVSQVLSGIQIDKTSMQVDNGVFRVFSLAKMPIGASSEALLNRIKQQDQLYTRFRSTQVFDELDKDAQKFEEWKKDQNH